MTIADWCILGAVLIYLLTLAPIKVLGGRDFRNGAPRDPAFYEPPVRARALGAHINGIETFPFFAAASGWPSSGPILAIGRQRGPCSGIWDSC